MFERCYSFFHYFLLSCRYVMLQKRILSKPTWGAKPPRPPLPSATTALSLGLYRDEIYRHIESIF